MECETRDRCETGDRRETRDRCETGRNARHIETGGEPEQDREVKQ